MEISGLNVLCGFVWVLCSRWISLKWASLDTFLCVFSRLIALGLEF